MSRATPAAANPSRMVLDPLLAKSAAAGRPGRTLAQHTDDVVAAFAALFGRQGEPTRLCDAWLEFFRIDPTRWEAFLDNGRAAAACHDWGKANDGFQRMLQRRGAQLVRHEHLSAVLIARDDIFEWLASGRLDVPLVLSAVVGHHLKARDVDFGRPEAEIDQLLRVRWDDADFQAGLATLGAAFGLAKPVPQNVPRIWAMDGTAGAEDLSAALDATRDRLDDVDRALRGDAPNVQARRRMLWAVRAALIAADAAGSGLPRVGETIESWIRDAFRTDDRLTKETVFAKVIRPRLAGGSLRTFQERCGDPAVVPERALLLAPCGFGKTLAAWRWIAARCDERPRGRAIFLYPTRGTATEGYRDYVSHAGPDEAALVHGTADLDLDGLHPDVSDEDRINAARLFALRQWPKRLVSATVDQFLGFLQHGYGPTCHLPLLADAVVVFDEVHSYDRGMFSALLEFLKHFDVPVLCMTATMLERPRERLRVGSRELGGHGLTVVNGLDLDGRDADGESALRQAADHGRYRVRRVADGAAAEEEVRRALREKERVLWVVNAVDRCQEIARRFADDLYADRLTTGGAPLYCYHSRYRLGDRNEWHREVVGAFKPARDGDAKRAVLAVTTQVCEMSLDLDADVLVSELAPATSLVQRLGRCCRDPKAHESGRVGDVILYEPEHMLPYDKQDMDGVGPFVDALVAAGTASQTMLEDLLALVRVPEALPKACRFIDSGPWAAAGEEQFRDANDLTRQAILASDDDDYDRLCDPARRGTTPSWKAQELLMNIPKKFTQPRGPHKRPLWLQMAQGGVYHKALGYCCGETTGPRYG